MKVKRSEGDSRCGCCGRPYDSKSRGSDDCFCAQCNEDHSGGKMATQPIRCRTYYAQCDGAPCPFRTQVMKVL